MTTQRNKDMAKSKQQKQKDREKRVAKKKLAEAAKRREAAKTSNETAGSESRAKKVIGAGVKQTATQPQVQSGKPQIAHRRAGG